MNRELKRSVKTSALQTKLTSVRKPKLVAVKNIKSDPASVYLSSLAASGRRSVRCQLNNVAKLLGHDGSVESFPWHAIEYQHIARVRFLMLDKGKAANTINLTLSAVRGVLYAAFNLGLIGADQLLKVQAAKHVNSTVLPCGRSLTSRQLQKLVKSVQNDLTILGLRDSALLIVLICTGARRTEAAHLRLSDYNPRNGKLVIRQGKGKQDRIAYIPTSARPIIRVWVRKRGYSSGALFCSLTKHGTVRTRKRPAAMSAQAIYNIVQDRAREAGIGKLSPHDLRRTFITCLLEQGLDINIVRQLIGHSDIGTTARYDYRTVDVRILFDALL